MQVAHGVNLEQIRKDGQHQNVSNEAENVVFEVRTEVSWSHDEWQREHENHDNPSHSQQTEVRFRLRRKLTILWVVHWIADLNVRVETPLCQEDYDADE